MSLYNDLTDVLTPYANKIKEVDESLDDLQDEVDGLFGAIPSTSVRRAISVLLSKAVYIEPGLNDELAIIGQWEIADVVSIEAQYIQTQSVNMSDALSVLISDLTVIATHVDGVQTVVSSDKYSLSGTFVSGTSTITVTCNGKTDTIDVLVNEDVNQRYLIVNDFVETTGFSGLSVTNGTVSAETISTFSILKISPILLPIKLKKSRNNSTSMGIVFRDNGDGTYYGTDATNVFLFTKRSAGTSYGTTTISDGSTITTMTKTGTPNANPFIATLNNGVLTLTYDNGATFTFTNANMFGLWSGGTGNANLPVECEVRYNGNI